MPMLYNAAMNNPFAHDVCQGCGSAVTDRTIHDEWHEKMDELIEWAQDVSESYLRAANGERGKPLGPNPGLEI